MEPKHDQIDLDTLAEVHRILSSTEFASIEDVAARGRLSTVAPAAEPAVVGDAGAGASPLPRRR